jgi:hypothetical protein
VRFVLTDFLKIFTKNKCIQSNIFDDEDQTIVLLNATSAGLMARRRFVHDTKNAVERLKRMKELLSEETRIDPGLKRDLMDGLKDSYADLSALNDIATEILYNV